MLHPQAKFLLDLMVERRIPPTHTLSPADARASYRDRRAVTQPEPPPIDEARDLKADGPAGPIAVRLVQPQPDAERRAAPPVLVLTAGYDPLRDEGLQYSQRLTEAGNRCAHLLFERQIHGFVTMGKVIGETNTGVAICADELRRALR